MRRTPLLYTTLFLLLALFLSLAFGSVFLSPKELWNTLIGQGTEISTCILWRIRLPRTILIALTGAALGSSGPTYQGLFRNPLADPFLIGVASGAALSAVIAMSIRILMKLPNKSNPNVDFRSFQGFFTAFTAAFLNSRFRIFPSFPSRLT